MRLIGIRALASRVLAIAVMHVPWRMVARVNHHSAWLIVPVITMVLTVVLFRRVSIAAVGVAVVLMAPSIGVFVAVLLPMPIAIVISIAISISMATLRALFFMLCAIVITRHSKAGCNRCKTSSQYSQ